MLPTDRSMQLHILGPPRLRFDFRNGPELSSRALRPNLSGICFCPFSFSSAPHTTVVRQHFLSRWPVRSDYKRALIVFIRDINHFQQFSPRCSAYCDDAVAISMPLKFRVCNNPFNFFFTHPVVIDMGQAGKFVDAVSQFHLYCPAACNTSSVGFIPAARSASASAIGRVASTSAKRFGSGLVNSSQTTFAACTAPTSLAFAK